MALGDGYYNTHRFAQAAAEYSDVISFASDSKVTASAQAKLHQAAEQRAKLRPLGRAAQKIAGL